MLKRKRDISADELKDLGFGSKVTQQSRFRLLNHDGSFNVERRGLSFYSTLNLYHSLLTMPWWKFHLTILSSYLVINASFAMAFLLCGPNAIEGATGETLIERFLNAFFFSVQTFTTLGYGHLNPNGLAANFVATFASFFGLFGFAFATGLLFARFSRPTAKIIFSNLAIIAPYGGITAFEFRIANARRNQLNEVEVHVLYTQMETLDGKRIRRFYELVLERQKVAFLPLHLTVVHPIDKTSPLFGLTSEDLHETEAEFLILVTAVDDTFSQTVHVRSSYRYDEIVWGAKFRDIFKHSDKNVIQVDLHRIHEVERLEGAGK